MAIFGVNLNEVKYIYRKVKRTSSHRLLKVLNLNTSVFAEPDRGMDY